MQKNYPWLSPDGSPKLKSHPTEIVEIPSTLGREFRSYKTMRDGARSWPRTCQHCSDFESLPSQEGFPPRHAYGHGQGPFQLQAAKEMSQAVWVGRLASGLHRHADRDGYAVLCMNI